MIVAVSGSSGLVGSALVSSLAALGHAVRRLVRPKTGRAPGRGDIPWDPEHGRLDADALAGCDAVVHLAGENIAARRWNDAQKRRLRDSRVAATALLASSLKGLPRPPRVLVQASAVGYYGDRGDEVLTETSPPGRGFLPDLCRDWESASAPARDVGLRIVHVRFGIILSARGGALKKMLLPFRLGIGGSSDPDVSTGRGWRSTTPSASSSAPCRTGRSTGRSTRSRRGPPPTASSPRRWRASSIGRR